MTAKRGALFGGRVPGAIAAMSAASNVVSFGGFGLAYVSPCSALQSKITLPPSVTSLTPSARARGP